MTPGAHYTVRLLPLRPHPEVRQGDNAIAFGIPCWWILGPSTVHSVRRMKVDCRLATDLFYSVIPRATYEEVGMRVDSLSDSPHANWQGVACWMERARFGLVVDEMPRPSGDSTDDNRPLLPCEMPVLIPEQDPPDILCQPLFGTSFLVQVEALVRLDCRLPGTGHILIPQSRRRG